MNWQFRRRSGVHVKLPDALKVEGGRTFGASYSDADLVERAQIDGSARIYTNHWGENRETHLTNEVFGSAAVQQELLGHQLADARLELETELEARLPQLMHGKQSTLFALRAFESAALARQDLEREISQSGVPLPHVNHFRRLLLGILLLLLAVGELYVLSPAFQVLGLGDTPVGWYLPLNPQQIAALSSVVALIVLSHALGERRSVSGTELRGPARSWIEALAESSRGHRLHIAGVVALVLGLTTIRELYFAQKVGGQPAAAFGFLLLNVGIVLAVQHIARPDDRTFADRWHAVLKQMQACEKTYHRELNKLTTVVAEYNKLVAIRAALLGKYWHAMRAVSEEANRQAHLIASSARLAQPQVVVEKMFPDGVVPARESDLCQLLERELVELSKDSPVRIYRTIRLDDIQEEFTALCVGLGGGVEGSGGQPSMAESPEDSWAEVDGA
jgi:hypothetical protein